ncbi:hypothetical protein [Halobacillus sp. Marseille-Q1614]|uniref:hypothetical protein n=1 Tax=Halobacillus sp. Marseille-Q1614 TaxID=2709134 RepID=UPI00156F964A|nr:hypothetical protein [Halobacillus sp. Marseille-Q1614]
MAESKKEWNVVFLLDSKREVSHQLELSEELNERETLEFIEKQLERGDWWFLEDSVALHTSSVESYYLENRVQFTQFSK